jgi:hypothetical protein
VEPPSTQPSPTSLPTRAPTTARGDGAATRPSPRIEPAAPPVAQFTRWYLSIAGIASVHTFGRLKDTSGMSDGRLSGGLGGGLHLAGYWVASPHFHLGGYLSYLKAPGDEVMTPWTSQTPLPTSFPVGGGFDGYGLGAALKVGTRLVERLWLGVAFDVGLAVHQWVDSTRQGLTLFPRAQLDVIAAQLGQVRVAVFTALGYDFVQYVGGGAATGWTGQIVWLLGISVGT